MCEEIGASCCEQKKYNENLTKGKALFARFFFGLKVIVQKQKKYTRKFTSGSQKIRRIT